MSGRFTSVNPAFLSTRGFGEAELTTTPFLEFVHPEDRAATLAELEGLQRGNPTLVFENRYRTKDGGWCWLAWKATPWPEGGLIYATARDITRQRADAENIRQLNTRLEQALAQRTAEAAASEERFRLMVEQVQDYAIFMLDCEGRVTSWNSGAQRAKGYEAAEILGRDFSCFHTAEDIAAGRPAALLAEARAKGRARDEGWRVRRDGSRFWAEVFVTTIQGQDGGLRGFAEVTHDLTERRKVEAQSIRSQRLESIGTLAGGIAHDLNNALAPVLMGIEVLRSSHPGSSDILDMVEASAARGADMVRHLLTFAKGVEGERVAVSPARLVGEVARIVQSTFPKNLQLVTRVPEQTPALLGDATQLHQVLLNLCVNARDAMPGGGRLAIEAAVVEVDAAFMGTLNAPEAKLGRYVRLRVIDSGTGIPPEIIDRIFDPFFTTKAPDRGSGLGLSNCLGIVRAHGGFFHVYSHPGRGTTIAAYLPIAAADAVSGATSDLFVPGRAEPRGQGEQILFVDDEEPVRAIARRVLAALGYTPMTATDGTDALIQAAQSRQTLHAVITDLHMPHMEGEALVRALRRMSPELPIIAASGRIDEVVGERLRQLGVKIILPKPFTQEQLARAIAALRQEPPARTRPPFGGGSGGRV